MHARQVYQLMKHFIPILLCTLLAHVGSAAEPLYHVGIEVTSPLPKGNVPMDPTIDFGEVIREHGGKGVLDPNSFEVVNVVTGKPVPFARSEDFVYGDRGRLEWVITDPGVDILSISTATSSQRKHKTGCAVLISISPCCKLLRSSTARTRFRPVRDG